MSQNELLKSQGRTNELLETLIAEQRKQKGVIGGQLYDSLPFLEGWTYESETRASPILLNRGGPHTRIVTWTTPNNLGWIMGGQAIFSDPDSRAAMHVDNAFVDISPRDMHSVKGSTVASMNIECHVYHPADTPPRFGILVGAENPMPVHNFVTMDIYHPASAPTATSYCWLFHLIRIKINDKKQWYEGLKKLGLQETQGKMEAV